MMLLLYCFMLYELTRCRTMQGCFRKHPETYADDLRYIDGEKEAAEAGAPAEVEVAAALE